MTTDTKSINPDTLKLIYEHTRSAPDEQAETLDALIARAAQVFAVASIVMGVGGVADGITGVLIGAMIAYGIVVACCLLALWPRVVWKSTHADWLWPNCWHETPDRIRHTLVADIVEVHARNKPLLRQKSYLVFAAIIATAVEVGLVVTSVSAR